MTHGIVRSIKIRDKMYQDLKTLDPNTADYNTMKCNLSTFNRILKKTIRHAKFSYYNDLLNKYRNDSKKTWSVINSLTNVTKNKKDITSFFIINGIKETNSEIIANNFNDFFATIGKNQASKIPSVTNVSYTNFLNNQIVPKRPFWAFRKKLMPPMIESGYSSRRSGSWMRWKMKIKFYFYGEFKSESFWPKLSMFLLQEE